jgi:mono/diheme cytochrome c family protein
MVVGQEETITIKMVRIDYKLDQLLQPTNLPEEVLKGRTIWLQQCAFCHDGVGTPTYNTLGPWLDADTVKARGDASIRVKILNGSSTMPGFQYSLSGPKVDEVVAFLKTVSSAQRPTADQKAGKAALPGGL